MIIRKGGSIKERQYQSEIPESHSKFGQKNNNQQIYLPSGQLKKAKVG